MALHFTEALLLEWSHSIIFRKHIILLGEAIQLQLCVGPILWDALTLHTHVLEITVPVVKSCLINKFIRKLLLIYLPAHLLISFFRNGILEGVLGWSAPISHDVGKPPTAATATLIALAHWSVHSLTDLIVLQTHRVEITIDVIKSEVL